MENKSMAFEPDWMQTSCDASPWSWSKLPLEMTVTFWCNRSLWSTWQAYKTVSHASLPRNSYEQRITQEYVLHTSSASIMQKHSLQLCSLEGHLGLKQVKVSANEYVAMHSDTQMNLDCTTTSICSKCQLCILAYDVCIPFCARRKGQSCTPGLQMLEHS